VYLGASRKADWKFDIYNSDGGWAEMSGNGLRIAGLHVATSGKRRKHFRFETCGSIAGVWLTKKLPGGYLIKGELGEPQFETSRIPVKVRQKYFINSPLKIGPVGLPATCVSVGNPHAVLVVENFDLDWQSLGAEIETSRMFPNRTNVEFAKVLSRNRISVRSWERGAGPTASSGTGAAASVAALVMQGLVNRSCEVILTPARCT
jgi:diaminopimelate epimerase